MRRNRRGGGFHQDFGGSGEDSFVAVVVTKLTGALLFILLLTMVIMALIPKADQVAGVAENERPAPRLLLEVPEILPEAVLGRRYEYAFAVRGDSAGPLAWSIREELPDGLSFDTASGRLIGSVNDSAVQSVTLTIQVTDGRTVAGAVTSLPVWNPETELAAADNQASRNRADPVIEAWLSQGFGLALIWFGHIAGMGVIGRIQKTGDNCAGGPADGGRFGLYRISVRLMTFGLTGALIYWMLVRG